MKVIPVIDLRDAQVVRAIQGQRTLYQPICSPLCPSSDPVAVVEKLLNASGSDTIYIADLNSIQAQGDNRALIERLSNRFPEQQFWLDAGLACDIPGAENISPVLGSESFSSLQQLQDMLSKHPDALLSLDYFQQKFLGPDQILQHPELWPDRLILMTLDRVGSHQGADHERLTALLSQSPESQVFAAGGIRHLDDLQQLSRLGCHGALIASALHDLSINSRQLQRLNQPD